MTTEGTVATPLFWEEVNEELYPTLFTIDNVMERVQQLGCPFDNYFETAMIQKLYKVLNLVRD